MFILRMIHCAARLSRKIFGPRLPHYLKDLLGFVRYLNFFRLIPTMYMIIFHPYHFFKIIPSIIRGAKPYYTTPIQFALNIVTLQVTVIGLLTESSTWGQFTMIGINIALAALFPVTIAVTCVLFLIAWVLATHVWPINYFAKDVGINVHGLLLPLRPSTYNNLNWDRYLWAVTYFYGYFYLCVLGIAVGLGYIFSDIPPAMLLPTSRFGLFLFALALLLLTKLADAFFLRPYNCLLLAASRDLTQLREQFPALSTTTRALRGALELKGVSAGYGETVVLEQIDLALSPGECISVIGRNGVGKSTLLSTIMGHTTLHQGEIMLGTQSLNNMPVYRRSASGVGFVPQEREIFPSLTVLENLEVGARAGHWTKERVFELFPNLKERLSNMGNQLSGGEQQMLSIARALLTNPTVLLMDEPTEGLAPVVVETLTAVLLRLRGESDLSIILVEQNSRVAFEFSTRTLVMDKGRIVYDGESATLRDDPERLAKLIGVSE